jgi:hypothetical protein
MNYIQRIYDLLVEGMYGTDDLGDISVKGDNYSYRFPKQQPSRNRARARMGAATLRTRDDPTDQRHTITHTSPQYGIGSAPKIGEISRGSTLSLDNTTYDLKQSPVGAEVYGHSGTYRAGQQPIPVHRNAMAAAARGARAQAQMNLRAAGKLVPHPTSPKNLVTPSVYDRIMSRNRK